MTNEDFTALQAEIHRRIAPLLVKQQQGRVMGAIREVLRQYVNRTTPTPEESS